ncbi:RagB/SusD family nutrient uptake outer membrane protein [Pedobacter hiemivivus]|uniref:RagB/SusD family nutrient uptake outer membrane protein n=1 Tax=Pedobacter hiemivivus TaxID=2530454 RepID=A0A4U1GEX8_9SPHI|nr:RagB/SusD family nutrient uptake outer membrane protein [Pedobacter hiemivivus]TKC62518.1 RagB/SusD family nutrient uptake outer membrane protein [Pedobacter hiemivivus]
MKTIYKKNTISNLKLVVLISIIIANFSCKKFLMVDPPITLISSKLVFDNDGTANSAMAGIYIRMAQTSAGFVSGSNSITTMTGLSSDELTNYSTTDLEQLEFFNNQVNPANGKLLIIWSECYRYIYSSNSIIEGLAASNGVSEVLKRQITGEALFIRAFCHFQLVNLFGEVPLVLNSDYTVNRSISKSTNEQIYNSIIKDLQEAKELLNNSTIDNQRTRVNKAAVTAFLARVYLYHREWEKSELEATALITNNAYKIETLTSNVFLVQSKEAIWQIPPVVPQYNTFDGFRYILTNTPTNLSLNKKLGESIPANDARSSWVGQLKVGTSIYYYPFKYKVTFLAVGLPPIEYLVALRLAEQYLIRSEARTQLNKISEAQSDLNVIRKRAGLSNTMAANKAELLLAIENERQIEFFAEWGHRWYDLKRNNRANEVLSVSKSNWKATALFFPIPQLEQQQNPNL